MAPLRGVREGDVVLVDIRGRVFFAVVGGRDERGLKIRPIDSRISYLHATARQVVDVYRRRPRA